MRCPQCKSKKVEPRGLAGKEVDGWGHVCFRQAHVCMKCGEKWIVLVREGLKK